MNVFQSLYQDDSWQTSLPEGHRASLVLVFGGKGLIEQSVCRSDIAMAFPGAEIIGCSTSGEILGPQVYDESLSVTAIDFDQVSIQACSDNIDHFADSESAGSSIAAQLNPENLKHVLVFADGQKVNGSALVKGMEKTLPPNVSITGGLAADGERFEQTWLWHNQKTESGMVVLCGLYGDSLRIAHASFGGWDVFGPDRLITKAEGNVLYELDGESALQLYKRYLGEHAGGLPGSALLFPLFIHTESEDEGVVRTILQVDEETNSMTFAGDLKEGDHAQLMHANFDRLIDGAEMAAKHSLSQFGDFQPSLSLLISCVGRRIVLNQRVEEELEAVTDILGPQVPACGFYSYGEISPLVHKKSCALHNQTMTITLFSEATNA